MKNTLASKKNLHVLSVFSLIPSNTSFPVAIPIFKMVYISGVITPFCLAKTPSSLENNSLLVDLPIFPSLSLITGDSLHLSVVIVLNNTSVYVLELTVGFESNIEINNESKAAKYKLLIANFQRSYPTVDFINLSTSALGIFGTSSGSFLSMVTDLKSMQKLRKTPCWNEWILRYNARNITTFLLNHSLTQLNSLWSSAQNSWPKIIFNFTVWYLNNTLVNHINLQKRKLSSSPNRSFCLKPELLLHIVAGCTSYHEDSRYIWRNNSA